MDEAIQTPLVNQEEKGRTFLGYLRGAYAKTTERKGVALTEMALYMVVFCVMLMAAWHTFSGIRESRNISDTKQYLMTAVAQIQQMYSGETYSGIGTTLTVAKQVALGLWPKEYYRNSIIHNAWGGKITIAEATLTSSDGATSSQTGEYFKITFTGLPYKSCVEMAQFGSDWAAVTINSKTYTAGDDASTGSDSSKSSKLITSATANTDCSSTKSNTIAYTSY